MSKQQTVKRLWATIGMIGQVRWVLNDAMNKGWDVCYQEEGGFFKKIFTIKGNAEDVEHIYNHILSYR